MRTTGMTLTVGKNCVDLEKYRYCTTHDKPVYLAQDRDL
jgi:hypothetical protein